MKIDIIVYNLLESNTQPPAFSPKDQIEINAEDPADGKRQETQRVSSRTWIGVGLGSGAFVLVFVSLLTVFIKRRMKMRKRYNEQMFYRKFEYAFYLENKRFRSPYFIRFSCIIITCNQQQRHLRHLC